jgi:UDP-GlcNAc:undecaprenyl-phosphate GlcNAc-1-phosphate transferase
MRIYFLVGLIAIASTYFTSPIVKKIAVKIGGVAQIRKRDVHQIPTPRLGGLAMLIGMLTATLFANFIPSFSKIFELNPQIWSLLIGSTAIAILGAVDDLFELDWMLKLGGQIIVALYLTLSGFQIISLPIAGMTIGSPIASSIITVFLIVAIMNAVNFIDGLDGLAAGIIAIGSTAFFLYSYQLNYGVLSYSSLSSYISVITIGICVGFLFINSYPAKIFMGDTGSMLLGLLISCSSLYLTGRINIASSSIHSLPGYMPLILPLLIFLLPLFDMVLAIVRRLMKKKSPFSPDKRHIHHRILRLGFSKRSSVLIIYIWVTLVCVFSIVFIYYPKIETVLLFTFGVIILGVFTLSYKKVRPIFPALPTKRKGRRERL